MFDAARKGDSGVLLAAVDAGLPANMTNSQGECFCRCFLEFGLTLVTGNTLLMLAAYAGHLQLTKELLDRGADPNRLNDLGQSIMAGAVFKSHDGIVSALMDKGADPRIGSPNAIQSAHMFGRSDLLKIMGAKDGDVGPEVPTPPSTVQDT